MVYTAAELRGSLAGAWELFKGRAEGLRAFDLSVKGFWRSFTLIVLLAAPYALLSRAEMGMLIQELPVAGEISPSTFYTAKALGLVLNWVGFPLVLALLARPLGLTHRYVAYVVARNWCELLAIVPFAFAALLYLIGAAGADAYIFMTLVATGVALRYQYLVARLALGASISFAVGLVLFDSLLSLVVFGQIVGWIVGV